MIHLTWGNLRDDVFRNAMAKLANQPMGLDLGMRVALISREIKKQRDLASDTHAGLLKKYSKPSETVPGSFDLFPATRAEYDEEMKKFDKHSFDVNVSKINVNHLNEKIPLTPQDLMVLEPILQLSEIPEGEQAEKKSANP